MKYFEITVDTTFTSEYYVKAETQEQAEGYAIKQAHDNHHGESIIHVAVAGSWINHKPEYPDSYEEV
jgi:hypothetical protein